MDTSVATITVGKLYQWKVVIPNTFEIYDTHPSHVLHSLNSIFRLTMRLKEKSGTKLRISAKPFGE